MADPMDRWAAALGEELEADLTRETVDRIAAAAAERAATVAAPIPVAQDATAPSVGLTPAVGVGAASAASVPIAVKVLATIIAALIIGGGLGAVTGVLPDGLQTWVADLIDGIGIELPRPLDDLGDLPDITITDVTVPDVTVPDVTVPDVTVPDVTVPDVTVPDAAVNPGDVLDG